ncbi:LacI family DNA-binding transcriptional regulator [Paenibacillus hamazuiensis]|uniref:LacI family DNA-binding transcriptional regulator n=1 Tax=Paenibacillus hamazuiensis TaxID=2936508 RepID=UPI00200BDA33|nr:LacI family DNA-binding transcriptional regulator [Paenibacillus hamazuiensis]
MSKRSVTIVDIAEAAGVSIATVSNVLNRRNVPMTEETIRKVEQTAKELGYRRNAIAANLSRKKSYELGLIVPSFGAYYGRFAEAMEQAAHANGYHMSVFSAGGMNPDMEKRHLEVLLSRRVDGLFCHGLAMSPESTRAIVGDGTPLVLFNGWGWPEDIALGAVNLDFSGGCTEAVRHLADQGCRSLFYLSRRRALAINEQRLTGFREGVSLYAEPSQIPAAVLEITPSPDSLEQAAAQIKDKVAENAGPVGVLAFDDSLALAFMSKLLADGTRVPEHVKIVGINNDPFSAACYPAITTLDIDYDRQAELAVRMMLDHLEANRAEADSPLKTGDREIRIPMKLIPRMSSMV